MTTASMHTNFKKTGLALLAACLLMPAALRAADEIRNAAIATDADLASLDDKLHQFSAHFYPKLIQLDSYPKIGDIDALVQTVNRYRSENDPLRAAATVISNQSLVEKYIDDTPIIDFSRALFEANEWNSAAQLYKKVKAQADKSLVSNVSLSLEKYYFSRNQWDKVIDIAASIGSELPAEDNYNALLMRGIALQRLQKHRQALVQYAKIPKVSRYYPAARLNMAVANIRQDWWTDAHIIIDELISDRGHADNDAMTDRLYTVLGYSLLQQQYFRNSRDAFRNVSLDGQYTNKALLGIALTAAYQEDYIGALNAVRILKDKKVHDLSVDEAYLLLPYFYEKLRQFTTASTGYAEAIKYYEARTVSINAAMAIDPESLRQQLLTKGSGVVTVSDEALDLAEKLPGNFFDNIRLLALYQPHVVRIGDTRLLAEYNALNNGYNDMLRKAVHAMLAEKTSYLTHYMSQSRYGLARMQDNDATSLK
jgi:hypothetical protein